MSLFNVGNFTLHSGAKSDWIIDCRELAVMDWTWAAVEVAKRTRFSHVFGIPDGGIRFAEACRPHRWTAGPGETVPILLVDDVLTEGQSMEEARRALRQMFADQPIVGFVLFDRTGITTTSTWINALWRFAD